MMKNAAQLFAPAIAASAMDEPKASAEPPSSPPERSREHGRVSLLQAMRGWLMHTLRHRDSTLKEVLEEVIEEHRDTADEPMAAEERLMLHNVLSFSDIKVYDIMVPRADIAAVPIDIPLSALKMHIMEQRHTRIPVYAETLDHVKGFIHVKDLLPMLSGDSAYDLESVKRDLLFVPPSMRILDLLVKMRLSGSHMAVVVDEYGGTDGLVTMEDLFEEIVGDIQDEHDDDEENDERILRVSEGVWEVAARIRTGTLEKELGVTLASEDQKNEFDTLGGLIVFELGRVPSRGEIIAQPQGISFEILDADPRRIRRVRILRP